MYVDVCIGRAVKNHLRKQWPKLSIYRHGWLKLIFFNTFDIIENVLKINIYLKVEIFARSYY